MAKATEQYIGTEDLVGATVVNVGYDEITFTYGDRTFRLGLEYEANYHSMCEGDCCGCGSDAAYFRAVEIV